MTYENYENKNRKHQNYIIYGLGGIIILLVLLLTYLADRRSHIIYKTSPYLDQEFLEKDICRAGFHSIIKHGAVESLVTTDYLLALEKDKYKSVDLKIETKNYRLVQMSSKKKCKIIIKDPEAMGHGLRSFQIRLEHNPDFIFNYKIASISEVLLQEEDVQRGHQ